MTEPTALDLLSDDMDAQEEALPEDKLERVVVLVNRLVEVTQRIADIEAQLDEAKRVHKKLEQVDIPELIVDEIGLGGVDLPDGRSVAVSKYYTASISAARLDDAHAWLREHGFGGMIKKEMKLDLGKMDDEVVTQIKEAMASFPVSPEVKETVHWQTLRAFVRERLEDTEAEEELPTETFGVFIGRKTTIK